MGVCEKMLQNINVSMGILLKVCKALNCVIGDVIESVPNDTIEMQGAEKYILLQRKNRKSGTSDEDI